MTADRITVVRVEAGDDAKAYFSEPVYLRNVQGMKDTYWWYEGPNPDPDELEVYMWGLGVIEDHYALIQKEQTNVARL